MLYRYIVGKYLLNVHIYIYMSYTWLCTGYIICMYIGHVLFLYVLWHTHINKKTNIHHICVCRYILYLYNIYIGAFCECWALYIVVYMYTQTQPIIYYIIWRCICIQCAPPIPQDPDVCGSAGSGGGRTEIMSNAGFPGLGPLVVAPLALVCLACAPVRAVALVWVCVCVCVSINISRGLPHCTP